MAKIGGESKFFPENQVCDITDRFFSGGFPMSPTERMIRDGELEPNEHIFAVKNLRDNGPERIAILAEVDEGGDASFVRELCDGCNGKAKIVLMCGVRAALNPQAFRDEFSVKVATACSSQAIDEVQEKFRRSI